MDKNVSSSEPQIHFCKNELVLPSSNGSCKNKMNSALKQKQTKNCPEFRPKKTKNKTHSNLASTFASHISARIPHHHPTMPQKTSPQDVFIFTDTIQITHTLNLSFPHFCLYSFVVHGDLLNFSFIFLATSSCPFPMPPVLL